MLHIQIIWHLCTDAGLALCTSNLAGLQLSKHVAADCRLKPVLYIQHSNSNMAYYRLLVVVLMCAHMLLMLRLLLLQGQRAADGRARAAVQAAGR
jgi:hypothetical protein